MTDRARETRKDGEPVTVRGEAGARDAGKHAAGRPLLDEVRRFAYPRGSGGPGELRAGEDVAAELREAGLDVHRESFTASRTALPRLRLFAHGIGSVALAAVGVSSASHPGAAAVLALAGLAWMGAAARWNRRVERAFDTGAMIRSDNVEGVRAGRGDRPLRIVVMAHRDTKSSLWPTFVPAFVLLLCAVSLLVAAVWLGAVALGGGVAPSLVAPACILAAALVVVGVNPSGDASPGAMDNASGLAVLLAAARTLPAEDALRDAELRFLCTGAEEIGLAGAMRWIQAHAEELDAERTLFVNVDSVGVGTRLLAADVRGTAPGGVSAASLLRTAAREAGVPLRILSMLPAAGVDTMPIASRGFATVTLLGEVTGRAALRIHSARDTADHLNEEGLHRALRLVRQLAVATATAAS